EHLPDPGQALRRLLPALAPGGSVLVGTPNLSSLQARIGGDRWFHQDVPRHRTQFSELGLCLLLERSGLHVERVSRLVLDQNLLGMWQTLLNLLTLEPNVAFRLLKRQGSERGALAHALDVCVTVLGGAALLLPAVALELGAAAGGRGGTVAVLARRPERA
ncbi:MAG: methyltransferase domain-containing protein, partial [Gaiellaceae bacterium]